MRRIFMPIGLLACLACLAGCDGSFNLTRVLAGGAGVADERIGEVEPNNTFEGATAALAPTGTLLDLNGSMASVDDIDIYDLGPIAAGDRVTVTFANAAGLDLAAALFDEQQRLISSNDDRSWRTDLRPQLGVTVRRNCDRGYLVVAASPTATDATGSYTATVLHEQATLPNTRPQTVYLNFNGGKAVTIPSRSPVDIPTFSAGPIDVTFNTRTTEMISSIVSKVRTHFGDFNVDVVASTESASIPGDATVIYFGTYDPNLLGLADSVDEYNADLTQKAIIFTDTFSLFMPLKPSLEQMAIAIANVASHEAGHLLGLEHTQQWTDLMDTTAPAMAMLSMQRFELAPLYHQVFPIGQQDGALLLSETLGKRPVPAASNIDRYPDFANTVTIAEGGSSAISEGATLGFQHASQAAEVSPDVWRLLLYGQGSVQDEVEKDCFAVHSHGSPAR